MVNVVTKLPSLIVLVALIKPLRPKPIFIAVLALNPFPLSSTTSPTVPIVGETVIRLPTVKVAYVAVPLVNP